MVLLGIGTNDHLVNEHSWDGHVLGVERTGLGNVTHLSYNLSSVTLGGENRVEYLQLHGFVSCGHVPHLIAGSSANEKGIYWNLVVHHVFLTVIGDDFHDVRLALGTLVHLATLDARVDECTQANLAHLSWQPARHSPVQLGNLSLRKAVRNHFVIGNHVHPPGLEAPVRADDTCYQPFVCQVLYATSPIGLSARMQEG